ncbi:MAG: tRNA (adenosine(37)-N6)-dimethylallyltransferase MiaA [Omnitrophica bacterium RIFCSPLOWO2_01_FULL_45_10]|nr:MAG: tRNA (adenosine(37)-N6)-dimethylallyltransferase MiaA [Omnitrophica bacterium RIFCSPLOWO2_01_FULL_45_10]
MRRINTVIFIVGPTAVGKTRLAVKLAAKIGGEIISCDSMQIYKGLRILSQAPTAKDKKSIRHHLVAVLGVGKEYNAASFRRRAVRIINSMIGRKAAVPIIVGGSGLYVKSLIDGLFPSPPADLKFRNRMRRFIINYGSEKPHKELSNIDPEAAKKIHPNDSRRIIRALEIYHATGHTPTEIKLKTKGIKDLYDIRIFGLMKPRELLYSDINTRVDRMFEDGALDEVKRLQRKRLSKTAKAILGFKEIKGLLNKKYGFDTAKDLLKKNTRRFAKRQIAWFKQDSRIAWFDVSKMIDEKIISRMIKNYQWKERR